MISGTTAPQSYSSLGKMVDASSRRDIGKTFRLRKGLKISRWEGLHLIDEVLAEAAPPAAAAGSRATPIISSPRVNPALIEKEICEDTNSRVESFLTGVASDIVLPSNAEPASAPDEVVLVRKRKPKQVRRAASPSPAFTCPPRPEPGCELLGRGPDVGKYTPKFWVVERHAGAPVIPRHGDPQGRQGRLHRTRAVTPSATQSTLNATGVLASTDAHDLGGTVSGVSLQHTQRRPQSQADASESREFRKHAPRLCTAPFKSKVLRKSAPTSHDLFYYPFPDPGTTNYRQGKFRDGSRERDFRDTATPCGPNVQYEVKEASTGKGILQFSRAVSREDDRAHTPLRSSTPQQSLIYNPNVEILSTKSRIRGVTPFANQVSRPPPRPASSVEPLHPYFDSVVTRKKRGFVELSKMVRPEDNVYDEENLLGAAVQDPLNVSYDCVSRKSPCATFGRASLTNSPLRASAASTSVPIYDVKLESIRRHRPVAFMPRTRRDSGLVPNVSPDPVVDPSVRQRTPTTNIASQLSRDAREARYRPKVATADASYELPPSRPPSIVPFSKLKGR